MAVSKENAVQAFSWFKTLMDNEVQKKIAAANSYSLPPATTRDIGGVIIGNGLSVNGDGLLNVTIQGGQDNIIEAISVDGNVQSIVGKTAKLDLKDYAKKSDIAGALSSVGTITSGEFNVIEKISVDGTIQPVVNKTAILGLSAYAKKSEVASGIRMKGSVNFFSDLPSNAEVGDLYNIQTAGGFDGDGTAIKAGDNVVYTASGKWDVMAGFVDTSIFAKKTDIAGLSNYTLTAATTTKLGGIIVGDGLEVKNDGTLNATVKGKLYSEFTGATSITGGDSGLVPAPNVGDQDKFLCGNGQWVTIDSGETYDVFEGATASKGGDSGLVPAPAKGDNGKFLRGDGTWAALNLVVGGGGGTGGVTLGSDVAATQGALWQDFVQDNVGNKTIVLKLRYGDYEYNFNYDTQNYVGGNAPALITDMGVVYTLGMVPSTVDGGLWYEVNDNVPTLMMHKWVYDYGYNYDSITYKGSNANLYSYLPFDTTFADALSNIAWTNADATISQATWGGNGLKNTGKLQSKVLSSKGAYGAIYTIDFWLYLDTDTFPTDNVQYNLLIGRFTNKDGGADGDYGLHIKNGQLFKDSTLVGDIPKKKRTHIALTRNASNAVHKLYINGKYITDWYPSNRKWLFQFTFFANFAKHTFPIYIDHFRFFKGQVVWESDFEVPKAEDYLK